MDNIVLCPNPFRDRGLALAEQARKRLLKAGRRVVMSPVFVDIPADSKLVPLKRAVETAELIVPIGGDGTFLHVARQTLGRGIPLCCVDLGGKGFMASLEPEDIERVADCAEGKYRESRRMLIDVELIRDDAVFYRDSALNDAVVKSPVNCIDMEVMSDGVKISRLSGDGVIVSTPTGSTAYSMSAGGPIVEPEAENLIVTSICAHVMAAKSFVLSPEREVTVIPERIKGREAVLSVDGGAGIKLQSGDVVKVRRSKNKVILADMGLRSFYDTAFEKLTKPIQGGAL